MAAKPDKALTLPERQRAPIAPDVVKQIAMDIGKAVAHHIETMYPDAVKATSKNMLLSVRNSTYNEIIAALATTDEAEILERLERRKAHRRRTNAMRKAGEELAREREASPAKSAEEAASRLMAAWRRNGVSP